MFTENQLVFVYGSLRKGLGNSGILATSNMLRATATDDLMTMVSLGGFPAVDRTVESSSIQGELYECAPDVMVRLDRLESNGSFYTRYPTKLSTGETAWCYFIDGIAQKESNRRHMGIVESGDWKEYVNNGRENAA